MNTEELRKRIRNVIEYWNEDESLLYNECVDCLVNVFKDYTRSLVPVSCPDEILLEVRRHPSWSNDEIVLYVWNKCKKMLERIEENTDEKRT